MRIQSLFMFLFLLAQQAHGGTINQLVVTSLYNEYGIDVRETKIKTSAMTLNPQIPRSHDTELTHLLSEQKPLFLEFYKITFKLGQSTIHCDLMASVVYTPFPPMSAALQFSECQATLTPALPSVPMKQYNYAQSYMLDVGFDILYIGDAVYELDQK